MNETLSEAIVRFVAAETIDDELYENVVWQLYQMNATGFTLTKSNRRVEFRNRILIVSEQGKQTFPRCAGCRTITESARFRGEFASRLCRPCAETARQRTIEEQRMSSRRA